MTALLDKLLDITTCSQLIRQCHEVGSVCPGKLKCKTSSHLLFLPPVNQSASDGAEMVVFSEEKDRGKVKDDDGK